MEEKTNVNVNTSPTKDAMEIASENYKEYSLYVGQSRVYPGLLDGCKASYKRAIYGMAKHSPRSIVKVAKLTRRCCCLSSSPKFNFWSNCWTW